MAGGSALPHVARLDEEGTGRLEAVGIGEEERGAWEGRGEVEGRLVLLRRAV